MLRGICPDGWGDVDLEMTLVNLGLVWPAAAKEANHKFSMYSVAFLSCGWICAMASKRSEQSGTRLSYRFPKLPRSAVDPARSIPAVAPAKPVTRNSQALWQNLGMVSFSSGISFSPRSGKCDYSVHEIKRRWKMWACRERNHPVPGRCDKLIPKDLQRWLIALLWQF